MLTRHAIRRVGLAGAIVVAGVLATTRIVGGGPTQSNGQTAASTKADQLSDRLRHRLDAAEVRLKSLKANVQAMGEQTEKSLREKLDEARRKLRDQKEHIAKDQATLRARAEEKVTETEDAVREWKAKREIQRLNGRADRAEAAAVAAVERAAAAINEAEEAILDAAVARLDADAAQSSTAAPR